MGKRIKRWQVIWNIPRLLKSSWSLFTDSRVPVRQKLILAILGLGFFIWPFDIIPDFLPLLGQLDDVSVIFFLLNWFVNSAGNKMEQNKDLEAEYYIVDHQEDAEKKK